MLFDEIEKAHPDVWNMLLQILEEGKLTDGQGRIASFRNAMIILSSNVGYSILSKLSIGFNPNKENTREAVLAEAKKVFRPEFLNRIDEITVFESLTPEHCSQILGLELEKVRQRTTYGSITLSPALHDHVLKEGFSEEVRRPKPQESRRAHHYRLHQRCPDSRGNPGRRTLVPGLEKGEGHGLKDEGEHAYRISDSPI